MTKWTTSVRAVEIRVTPGDETGNTFEGLACKYGVVDSYGTVFQPGCFTRGGLEAGKYALLWMHDPNRPVGTLTAEERQDGLYIVGQWDQNTAGQEARVAAMSGSASDLSVGFRWMNDSETTITDAQLLEVSQVTSRFGAVPGSKLTAVRHVLDELFDEEEQTTTPAPAVEEIEIAVPVEERWEVVSEFPENPVTPAETAEEVVEETAVEDISDPQEAPEEVAEEVVEETPKGKGKATPAERNAALAAYAKTLI